jgi:hypothetical protein
VRRTDDNDISKAAKRDEANRKAENERTEAGTAED